MEQVAPGSYSFTWDRSVNVTPPPPDGLAPAGLYVFDIDVIGVAPGYDEDFLRSRALTINNVTLTGLPVDAKDYVKVRVGYNLNDTVPPVLCKIEVWGYVFDSALNQWYWAKLGEENAPTNLGANSKDLVLLRSAIASVGGLIYFVIHALDNHPESYKNHQRKWALPKGPAIYHKILDVPHYEQTGDIDCDGTFDEDDPDEDRDGKVNEDPEDGIDNDVDGRVDEDGVKDDDGDGLVDEDPLKIVWCGEATSKMWIDYKHGFNNRDYNRPPTELEIAQWVLHTFDPDGFDCDHDGFLDEDRNKDGIIQPEERPIWPLEYGGVLNHFIPANKYHRYVSASQDEIIGREAYLIAEYHEPSAAVAEMECPDDPNDPSDNAWHWLLVVGCAADGLPGSGGVNVLGLWVHDPGGWFSFIPEYVSSDIWKQKYFEWYTDRDGARGYMHVEDPPPGDKRINHLLPIRCAPPTKPHGTPKSLQHVQQIAQEGVSLHLLNFTGPLVPYFQQAQIGLPVFVRALNPKFGDYYIVPYFKAGKVTVMVIVDAVTGQFHGASACTVNWGQFPPIPKERAKELAFRHSKKEIKQIELVWSFCEESKSPYTPLWRVTFIDKSTLFISQKGTLHRQITRHSCIRSELKR